MKLLTNVLILFSLTGLIHSQTYTWKALGNSNNGTNGNVYAITFYNGRIIAGGFFTTAGGINANNIAAYDPFTSTWSNLGTGISGEVKCLMVYGGQLYAGGHFLSPASNIARWNGSSWTNVGSGTNGQVLALLVHSGLLIVGGEFSAAGGNTANNVASWNGTSWSSFGSGLTGSGSRVHALTVYNSEMTAGGRFNIGSGNNVARWNGTQWLPFGNQLFDDRVQALTVYNGFLHAGGRFEQIGSNDVSHIARWNGSLWEEVGGGVEDNDVEALAVYQNNLIVAGNFKFAGTNNLYVDRIAMWDGNQWDRMLTGTNDRVNALYVRDTLLYAGGEFTSAGGKRCNHIAVWGMFSCVNVSGMVRYADNNQPVPSGKVKAVRFDISSREIIVLDSAIISNGSYNLIKVPQSEQDVRVIAFPDDELILQGGTNDFVPTYHPSTINWLNANVINTSGNQNGVNINVLRLSPQSFHPSLSNISGFVYLNILPPLLQGELPYLKGAIIYAKQGNNFIKATQSNSLQQYSLIGLNPGTYEIVATRLGYETEVKTVVLGSVNIDTVNFYLDSLNPIGINPINTNVPVGFMLYQNYPNPFNPTTKISFDLPVSSFIELIIYDVKGGVVYSLGNKYFSSGKYELEFDGSNLPSGVYFYKLSNNKFSSTRKMILIK